MDPKQEYDEYNYEADKFMKHSGGKGRTKKESEQHTNQHDTSGHTRKITTKLQNTESNKKDTPKPKS